MCDGTGRLVKQVAGGESGSSSVLRIGGQGEGRERVE